MRQQDYYSVKYRASQSFKDGRRSAIFADGPEFVSDGHIYTLKGFNMQGFD